MYPPPKKMCIIHLFLHLSFYLLAFALFWRGSILQLDFVTLMLLDSIYLLIDFTDFLNRRVFNVRIMLVNLRFLRSASERINVSKGCKLNSEQMYVSVTCELSFFFPPLVNTEPGSLKQIYGTLSIAAKCADLSAF